MPIDLEAMKNQASGFMQSDEMKSLLPYLLSGGAGALAGGMLTGRKDPDEEESRMSYMGRILRNALLTGGLAAGGHYLLNKGVDQTIGMTPDESSDAAPTDANRGPLMESVNNIAFSPVTAAGAGIAGLAATHGRPMIGAGTQVAKDNLRNFAKLTGADEGLLRYAKPQQIADLGTAGTDADRIRRLAGLPSSALDEGSLLARLLGKLPGVTPDRAGAIKGVLSDQLRRGALSTLGQTWPRRAGRGALGLAAAGLPALIGSFVTPDQQQV